MIIIRSEREEDIQAIRQINQLAFDTATESLLVDKLRDNGKLLVSLVAENDGELVGHIAFSPVTIESRRDLRGVGLGPMAVMPAMQKQQIGSQLIRAGLARCSEIGCDFAVVLGHAHYYPRFGFVPASHFGIKCFWPVPDDVFMAMELRPGSLVGVSDLALYEPEFSEF